MTGSIGEGELLRGAFGQIDSEGQTRGVRGERRPEISCGGKGELARGLSSTIITRVYGRGGGLWVAEVELNTTRREGMSTEMPGKEEGSQCSRPQVLNKNLRGRTICLRSADQGKFREITGGSTETSRPGCCHVGGGGGGGGGGWVGGVGFWSKPYLLKKLGIIIS